MFEEMHGSVSEFVNQWSDSADETPSALSIEKDGLDGDSSSLLLDGVEELCEHFDPGAITFQINGGEDSYRIRYNASNGSIQSQRTRATDYDISQLYRGNPELVDILEQIDRDRIDSGEGLREALDLIHRVDSLQVDAQYSLRKSNIEVAISQSLSATGTTVHFYFGWDFFVDQVRGYQPAEIRNELLEDTDSKALCVVLSSDGYAYSNALGVCCLADLDSSDWFIDGSVKWLDEMEDIRRQTLIQDPDRSFLPPTFFRFQSCSDDGYCSMVRHLFAPYVALFSLFSIVNSAERRNAAVWHVRLQGRQFIEGKIELESADRLRVEFDGEEDEIDLSQGVADDLYSLYSWSYRNDVENRITVVRNVATLYARNLFEVISDARKIQGSAESNRRYYVRESVDEFFEFRQDLTESAFETRREFATLRSELMSDLSRDIFRTFGFIIVIAGSTIFRLNDTLPPVPMYIAVSGLIFGYGIVTLRRVRGLRSQFIDLLRAQSDYVDFYSNFFDDEELAEMGLQPDENFPWWCGLLKWTWDREQTATDHLSLRCGFALDLWLYYLLILSIWVIAVGMATEAMGLTSFVGQIP